MMKDEGASIELVRLLVDRFADSNAQVAETPKRTSRT